MTQSRPSAVVSLVVWSPYKGEIPGHTLREAINEIEVDRLAADIPDGLSPVAALGAVCKPLGWSLYVRKNGGARWQTENAGAEVDQQGLLSLDQGMEEALAAQVRTNYALKASTIPGAKFSTYIAKDMRRRDGLSATEAGSAMLLPTNKTQDLLKLQHVIQQFGATFAVLPIPDPSVFMTAALVGLSKEIELLVQKTKITIEKAWASAKGNGRVKAYTQEHLDTELSSMIGRLLFWAEILEANPEEEKAVLEKLKVEVSEAFLAVASFRQNRKPKKVEEPTIVDDDDDEEEKKALNQLTVEAQDQGLYAIRTGA